jgi:SNF2 family DNA or RNA helicase
MLRPFILRRTKSQVARDLPEKTEEVIVCEMEPKQKKIYSDLKKYYRGTLLDKIEKEGIEKTKIHILEALLRLRQAACHPGLIDSEKMQVPSVKLLTLLEQVREIREEGSKCLIFSQFTAMLDIIRTELIREKIDFEYLDGSTRKRDVVVKRFNEDPDCGVFLISLKAGGVGLNLTSAEYVFIFDPWWNPAAEMQAIDRTHRIGQKKPVFAYRLVCKDSVEEKILEMQTNKRQLAQSVISSDESVLSAITVKELENLLS